MIYDKSCTFLEMERRPNHTYLIVELDVCHSFTLGIRYRLGLLCSVYAVFWSSPTITHIAHLRVGVAGGSRVASPYYSTTGYSSQRGPLASPALKQQCTTPAHEGCMQSCWCSYIFLHQHFIDQYDWLVEESKHLVAMAKIYLWLKGNGENQQTLKYVHLL